MEHVLCSRSQNSPNSTHRLSQTSCVRLWGFYTKSGSGGSTIFDSRSEAGGFPTVKSFSLVVYSNGHDCPWVYWLRSSSDKNKHSMQMSAYIVWHACASIVGRGIHARPSIYCIFTQYAPYLLEVRMHRKCVFECVWTHEWTNKQKCTPNCPIGLSPAETDT